MLLPLPPLCHPPPGAKTNQLVHYTTEEHKRDVRLRSAFLPAGKVILTPVNEPPNPRDVERWLESRLGERRPARIVGKSSQERLLDESVGRTTESESNRDAVASASGAGVGGAPDVIEIEIERESKSPVSVVSESSTVQLDQEQEPPSFTSYQLPKDARDSKPYASGRIIENESEIVSETVDFHDSSVSGELGSSRQHLLHSTPLLGGNGEKGTRERGDEKMVVETENRKEREGEQKDERGNSGSTPVRPSAVDGLVDSAGSIPVRPSAVDGLVDSAGSTPVRPSAVDGLVDSARPMNVRAHILRKSDCFGCAVLLCLVVCLTLLASFLLPSLTPTLSHTHIYTADVPWVSETRHITTGRSHSTEHLRLQNQPISFSHFI